eukprot:UN03519
MIPSTAAQAALDNNVIYTNWTDEDFVITAASEVDAKCIEMDRVTGKWNVLDCSQLNYFACEYVGEPVQVLSQLFKSVGCFVSDTTSGQEIVGHEGYNAESCHALCLKDR